MQVKVKGNTLIIIINGDLDHHGATEIKRITDKNIMENKIRNLIFDFKNCYFMDSSGVGVIMGRYKLVSNAGGRACAVNLTSPVKRIFQISGLCRVLEIYEDADEALNIFR